jgi:uncharacterized protein (TIGR03790 family)
MTGCALPFPDMMRFASIIICLTLLLSAGNLPALDLGGEVAVVYNTRVPESKGVADHYAEVRHVPENQVIGLGLPATETMTRTEYQDQLETPLRRELADRRLLVLEPDTTRTNLDARKVKEAKIRFLVLCYGVPLKIVADGSLNEPGQEKLPKELCGRNDAAVDSELCLLPWPNPHRMLSGFTPNPFYGATNPLVFNPANGLLIVARLDGPDATVARHLVDKAVQAEADGLWGRAYFDERGLPGGDAAKKGDDWILAAAQAAHQYGFDTVVDEQPGTFSAGFPMSQIALYAGWYEADVSGPFKQPNVEFMSGAFAYHLHSFSAWTLRSTTNHWCGPLLAKGATATMGCVEEPYLDGTPNLAIFFTRWLSGFGFGAAAYASQGALSWQTTVIGDPLYRPFGRDPRQLHESLLVRHSPMVEWSCLRVINLSLIHGVNLGKLTEYVHDSDPEGRSAILTEKLGELYQRGGHTNRAIESWRRALKLDSTPLQTIRLTFTLANALDDSGRGNEALAFYDDFLSRNPSYPDALALYQKMEPMAKRLHQKSKAKHYAAEIERLTPPPPAGSK